MTQILTREEYHGQVKQLHELVDELEKRIDASHRLPGSPSMRSCVDAYRRAPLRDPESVHAGVFRDNLVKTCDAILARTNRYAADHLAELR